MLQHHQGLEKMVGLERNLKGDEESQEAGVGEANADSANKRGGHGFLSTEFLGIPTEFCIPSTHPKEAVISSSLARQGTRRISIPA